MRYSLSLRCGALALFMACGPKSAEPGDTDTDPTSTGDSPGSTTTNAPDPTTLGDPTTGDPTTTGEPLTCPEGQEPWTRLGGGELQLPTDVSASRSLAAMADGRIAMAVVIEGEQSAPGVLVLSPTGEVLAVHAGEPAAPGEPVMALGIERAADDGLIVRTARGPNGSTAQGFARFAADGAPLGAIELGPEWRHTYVLPVEDDVVLVSLPDADSPSLMARMAADTGAVEWLTTIAGTAGDTIIQAVDIGPVGDILMSGVSNEVFGSGFTRMHVWRFDPEGAPVWSRATDLPVFDGAYALELGPDGQVFVLRVGPWPDGQTDLVALDFATGADLWTVTVAKADEQLRYAAISEIVVDDDALSFVVARSAPDQLRLESVGVQRVSFDGQLLEFIPLDVPPNELFAVEALRGACGELVILSSFQEPYWFGAFAP
ncbi:hypothetical protein [Nannocystis punicea]|uniref:Uncharacterized protein n=1 Tax=Nannocystis punicea TaxID=2995304 RepID=A0ABY7HET9_9BACT|nr:hypothetical protein [Nannocystis poenicansa]WAS97797.1 hypothetical protein O0S08_16775 [Nannocystis poenicansa]